MLFSWTLHAIVYFWLIPAYIGFYVLLPQAAGGRLYSDKMGRIAFLQLLIFSMPIGIHHLYADPQIGAGFKFLHAVFTGMVAVPTLLTIFTICASLEIAGRLRGGRGLFGWVAALPWERPFVLASGFSLLMLGLGGASGLINMSYALNSTIHNTQWVTGHFHLIYGGSIVIMYFAIAYELWPRLTGRPLAAPKLVRLQLWTWFVGMLLTTLPWHAVGVMGQPRRMAYFDFSDPALAAQAIWVSLSARRRLRAGVLRAAADRRAAGLASRAGDGGAAIDLLAGRAPAAQPAGLAQRLSGLGAAGAGADRGQLRLPAGAVPVPAGHRRSRVSGAGAMSNGTRHASPDSRFARVDRCHGRAVRGRRGGGFRLAALGATGHGGLVGCDLPRGRPAGRQQRARRGAGRRQPSSTVAWTPATRELLTQGDPARGAALATACNNCHGANGISADAAIPNLAGHSVAAIYKQLEDFKSNRRNAMVMGVFVAPLSQQQMLDLAAHYAALPNPLAAGSAKADVADAAAKALAEVGAPLRGIASCAACHGPLGQTPGAPGPARPAACLPRAATAGLQVGQPAQRHQRADAQRGPPAERRRNRAARGLLFWSGAVN